MARPVLRDADVRSAYLLGDFRTFLPYLVALGLMGLGIGALVGLAGSLTGLRAPWWMLLVGPAGNLALGSAAGLVLWLLGEPALRRFPDVPVPVITGLLSILGVLGAFFPIWFALSPLLVGPVLWEWTKTWVPLVAVAMTCVTLVIFSIYSSLAARLRVREEQGTALSRMLPGGVAERLPGRGRHIGDMESLLVTVLMSDVRGYSGLAEIADPSQLAGQVSGHRAAASRAILAEGGTIMQFVGDAVMAVFGAPEPQSNHAERALRASIAMHGAQMQLNQAWAASGLPAFRLGIGVSTGLVAAAFLGSEERMEYSVVGDPVNLAQRLQELAAGGQTVLSEASYNALPDPPDAERLGSISVKGRQGAINAFRLHAPPGTGAPSTIDPST